MGELFCRNYGPSSFVRFPISTPTQFARPHKPGFSALIANHTKIYRYPSNPRGYFDQNHEVHANINSLGMRGQEPGPLANTLQVAFLGDSFVFGAGVKDNDTIPSLVENNLKALCDNCVALNLAVGGSNTHFQSKYFTEFGSFFSPDIVVLVYNLNDLPGLSFPRRFSPSFTGLVDLIRFNFHKWQQHYEIIRTYQSGYTASHSSWRTSRKLLSQLDRQVERTGAEFYLVIHPILYRLDDSYPFQGAHTLIGEFASLQHISILDLFAVLKHKKAESLWVHDVDHHPNELANRISAKAIKNFLLEQSPILNNVSTRASRNSNASTH